MTESRTPDTAATGGLAAENRPAERSSGKSVSARIGPCAKQIIRATIVSSDGQQFVGTNYCRKPQPTCARAGLPTGQGYDLCRSVCDQPAHAEIHALTLAGECAMGATLYIEGHTYACGACLAAAVAAGIVGIVFDAPTSLDACGSGMEGRNSGSLQTVTAESDPLVTLQNQTPQ